jgi:hypothetical protein
MRGIFNAFIDLKENDSENLKLTKEIFERLEEK